VNPTALVPGARKDLLDCLPEAERTITDREVRRDLEPTLLDVDEELTPALRALAYPSLEADELVGKSRAIKRQAGREAAKINNDALAFAERNREVVELPEGLETNLTMNRS
jgi:hypothetical protein